MELNGEIAEAGVFPEHFCDLSDPLRHVTGVYPLEEGVFLCLLVGAGGLRDRTCQRTEACL